MQPDVLLSLTVPATWHLVQTMQVLQTTPSSIRSGPRPDLFVFSRTACASTQANWRHLSSCTKHQLQHFTLLMLPNSALPASPPGLPSGHSPYLHSYMYSLKTSCCTMLAHLRRKVCVPPCGCGSQPTSDVAAAVVAACMPHHGSQPMHLEGPTLRVPVTVSN